MQLLDVAGPLQVFVSCNELLLERGYPVVYRTTPAKAVEGVRLELARAALEGGAPVKGVARDGGFGTAETMRRAFLRVLGVGPERYRRRFGGG